MKTIALDKVIFFNYRLSALNETAPSTYSQYSFKEYDKLFRERIVEYNSQNTLNNISYTAWSTLFYDSLWAWSVVLDSITRKDTSLDLADVKYGNTVVSEMILAEFYGLDFDGISGRVKFSNESGFLTRAISVFQVSNTTVQLVAYYDGEAFTEIVQHFSIPDRFAIQIVSVDTALVVVFFIIAFIQLVVFIILHIMTIWWRQYRSVKASSVKLN